MHVLIRPRLLSYTSIVPAKLQDLRPLPSFTKSSMDKHFLAVCKVQGVTRSDPGFFREFDASNVKFLPYTAQGIFKKVGEMTLVGF